MDGDLPLLYTYGVVTPQNRRYMIAAAKQFSFIESKMFEGNLYSFVRICDQLTGCSIYNTNFTVEPYEGRLLSSANNTTYFLPSSFLTSTKNLQFPQFP